MIFMVNIEWVVKERGMGDHCFLSFYCAALRVSLLVNRYVNTMYRKVPSPKATPNASA